MQSKITKNSFIKLANKESSYMTKEALAPLAPLVARALPMARRAVSALKNTGKNWTSKVLNKVPNKAAKGVAGDMAMDHAQSMYKQSLKNPNVYSDMNKAKSALKWGGAIGGAGYLGNKMFNSKQEQANQQYYQGNY